MPSGSRATVPVAAAARCPPRHPPRSAPLQSVEEARPRRGLSVPVVTALDEGGALLEADQRALVRHVIQGGNGADVVFAAGTTGEWDRVPNSVRQEVVRVCTDEARAESAALQREGRQGVEVWAGITAHTREETLENLDSALSCGASAAVIAPLSIRDVDDPVRFIVREIGDLLDARPRRFPIYLYDNSDIAVDPRQAHIRTRQVKALSRLDFVRGIKVSAPRKVLGHYTRAAAQFRDRGEFAIYIGNAMLIFDWMRPRSGVLGTIAEHWNRYRLAGGLPAGVVSGPANALPREWARAWQACSAGDEERMSQIFSIVDAFRRDCHEAGHRTIACLKQALHERGVLSCAAVAEGTPDLEEDARKRFSERFEDLCAQAALTLGEHAASQWREGR